MPIEITKNLIEQLPKIFEKMVEEYCKIIIQFDDSRYISLVGFAFPSKNGLLIEGIKKSNKMNLYYNDISQKPEVKIAENNSYTDIYTIRNIYIEIINYQKKISNNWEPPMAILYPGKTSSNFPVLSQMDFMILKEKIFSNVKKNLILHISYFDENVDDLNEYLQGNKQGIPKIKEHSIECYIKHEDLLMTLDEEEIFLIYVQALKVPCVTIVGKSENFDFRLSNMRITLCN